MRAITVKIMMIAFVVLDFEKVKVKGIESTNAPTRKLEAKEMLRIETNESASTKVKTQTLQDIFILFPSCHNTT